MIEGAAAELASIDKDALAKVRADLAKLKTAWPAPMPPDAARAGGRARCRR